MCKHSLLWIVLAITVSCHSSNSSRASQQLGMLTNADVSWDGTSFGLAPKLSGRATEVLNEGKASVGELRLALDDPRKIVVAHVLLTKIRGGQYDVSGGSWNGLKVSLLASGAVEYDEANLNDVRDHWLRVLNSSTH
jgi:hypothetical protein